MINVSVFHSHKTTSYTIPQSPGLRLVNTQALAGPSTCQNLMRRPIIVVEGLQFAAKFAGIQLLSQIFFLLIFKLYRSLMEKFVN